MYHRWFLIFHDGLWYALVQQQDIPESGGLSLLSPLEFWGYAPLSEKLRLGSRNWSIRDVCWKPNRRTAWTTNDPVIEFPGMTPVQTRLPVPSFGLKWDQSMGEPHEFIQYLDGFMEYPCLEALHGKIPPPFEWIFRRPTMERPGHCCDPLGTKWFTWKPINEASPILPEMDSYKPYTSIF